MLDTLVALFRDRISPVTAVAAIVAAGGMAIMLVGVLSIQRVSLDGEAERISGVTRPSRWDQFQMRLMQSGLRIKLGEFLLIGFLVGIVLGAVLMLSGFVVIGLIAIPAGPVLYYRFLMDRRQRQLKAFRDQLPDAILDFIQYLAVKKDLVETIKEMRVKGPEALRPEFERVNSLIQRKVSVDGALEAAGQARSEAFFRQFMDALAQHHLKWRQSESGAGANCPRAACPTTSAGQDCVAAGRGSICGRDLRRCTGGLHAVCASHWRRVVCRFLRNAAGSGSTGVHPGIRRGVVVADQQDRASRDLFG